MKALRDPVVLVLFVAVLGLMIWAGTASTEAAPRQQGRAPELESPAPDFSTMSDRELQEYIAGGIFQLRTFINEDHEVDHQNWLDAERERNRIRRQGREILSLLNSQ